MRSVSSTGVLAFPGREQVVRKSAILFVEAVEFEAGLGDEEGIVERLG